MSSADLLSPVFGSVYCGKLEPSELADGANG